MKINNKIYKLFGMVFLSVLFLTSCNDYANPIPSVGEIYYAVEIFEYDPWPAPKETRIISKTLSNGEVLKIPFNVRSWQSPYNEEVKKNIPTWSFEKNSIKYNFKYKS